MRITKKVHYITLSFFPKGLWKKTLGNLGSADEVCCWINRQLRQCEGQGSPCRRPLEELFNLKVI